MLKHINKPDGYWPDKPEMVILEDATIEKSWGWVFFYDSPRYMKTGSSADAIAGNGPVIINRETGALVETGTAHPIEHYVREYELQNGYDT